MGGKSLGGRRVSNHDASQIAEAIRGEMEQKLGVSVHVAGSIRRLQPTCGDVDLVVVVSMADLKQVMDTEQWLRDRCGSAKNGKPKMQLLHDGVQVDITLVEPHQLGSAMLHCTGSKLFNIKCRQAAIARGLQLSQHGLFEGDRLVASKTEREVLDAIGMAWVEPTDR
jgi:DNA polymerase (family 10)